MCHLKTQADNHNMPKKDLPTFYYHTHFMEFLAFIKGPSAHLLNSEQTAFIEQFEALPHLEQCTLVRLINRKQRVIKRSSLVFDELPNIDGHLRHLIRLNMVGTFDIAVADDASKYIATELLAAMTKAELIELYTQCANNDMPKLMKSANKSVIQQQCKLLCHQQICHSALAKGYVYRNTDEHVRYFLFLYFGHSGGQLNQFSMRDLGLMRTRDDEQTQLQARFTDYQSAFSCFTLQQQLREAKKAEFSSAECITEYTQKIATAHGAQASEVRYDIDYILAKAMLTFNPTLAVEIVKNVPTPMASEFWCRQSYKLGQKDAVLEKLHALIDQPLSEQSLQFAEDFLARKYKQKRTSIMTDMLRKNTRHLAIDETYKGAVEQGVVAYYQSRGINAWRTENHMWNNLFGLVFWRELFELDGLGLATPFDYLPVCIKHHSFAQVANAPILSRLAGIKTSEDLLLLVTKHASIFYGKSQGIVSWRNNILDTLSIVIRHAPVEGLKEHLFTMCNNYQLYNDGYPDIMVLEGNQLRFEEIKGPGDSLRRNQLMQIQHLRQANIDVGITTVEYTLDPMQAYAIVDIETTGGRANMHKITEIGIVKMVNGEVVDQWQTLLNPQRRIPSMITQLTGITNDMVADAPLFCDIADELDDFTQGCIFVAHNVNFDYGFIREEYARLNRSYRRPKLCTVQQMRRYYKGLNSYSLANLTKHFGINMQRHHRALSDAIAASQLLKLVNDVRLKQQQNSTESHFQTNAQ